VLALAILVGLGVTVFDRFAQRVHAAHDRMQSGPAWRFPARVYSADVPLVVGAELPERYLEAQLDARGYAHVAQPDQPGTWTGGGGVCDIVLRGFDEAPDPAGRGGPERVRVRWSGNRIVGVERRGGLRGHPPPAAQAPPRLEPTLIALLMDEHRVRRTWVPLDRIPRVVCDAVIAAEDRRFTKHHGLDLRSNARALLTNVRAGGVREGGSTLTQQLARGLFLARERTLGRKLSEAVLSVGL
jgi:penicillin-binding protein 1B